MKTLAEHKSCAAMDGFREAAAREFPRPDGGDAGVAYFNAAGRTPTTLAGYHVAVEALNRKLLPWRALPGDGDTEAQERRHLRATYGGLVGAPNGGDDVAIMPSTAYAMQFAANNAVRSGAIGAGKSVIVLLDQMASNVMPWQDACATHGADLVVVPRPTRDDPGGWTEAVVSRMDSRTGVVALPPCHWCNGSVIDLERIGRVCADNGALLCIDATQAVGAMPIDAEAMGADIVAASGHKWLMCPYGFSFVYVSPRHRPGAGAGAGAGARSASPRFAEWSPLEAHDRGRAAAQDGTWDEDGAMTHSGYPTEFVHSAARFDAGGHVNPLLVPISLCGMKRVAAWRPERIQAVLRGITDDIADRASRLHFETPLPSLRVGHILGLRLAPSLRDTVDIRHVAKVLSRRGVMAPLRSGWIRISPHLYTTAGDVDKLIDALAEAVRTAAQPRSKL